MTANGDTASGSTARRKMTANGDTAAMSDHVYKTVEVTGSSPDGVNQAIDRAIAKAAETLRNLDWFELAAVRGQIGDDGRVAHYQATLKIGFRLDD